MSIFLGVHVLFYSRNADADRAFFRDVLELRAIDIGHGWLIFGLPPAEAAVHPADDVPPPGTGHEMIAAQVYLMCTSLPATIAALDAKNVRCTPVQTESWGLRTTIPLPSGGEIGLYQPTHPTALA
jgi:catechol 2,3-dioxygenase-like lactoylglutathione lyase family enzyme